MLRPIEGTAREYEYRRLSVLGDIVGGRLQAVCVPDEGLTQYTTPRAEFCNNTRTLHPGDTVPRHRADRAVCTTPGTPAAPRWTGRASSPSAATL